MQNELPKILIKYIETRVKKANEIIDFSGDDFLPNLNKILSGEKIIIGYRCTCSCTDNTMKRYRLWAEIVKKSKVLGYNIKSENVKVNNGAWAGGYWCETAFFI